MVIVVIVAIVTIVAIEAIGCFLTASNLFS